MSAFSLIIPLLFALLFLYALKKRVKIYDCFSEGVKGAIPLAISLFPYLASILILCELFEKSGLSEALTNLLAPLFQAVGVPPEIAKLVLIKPFSGSGATAVLSDILSSYGADSYIARCACVAFGSSETVFYVSAVYFSGSRKNLVKPIVISLCANLVSVVAGCLFCRFL